MAVFRCKMCGGDLEVVEGASSCTCEFCGTKQTIPTVKDEGLQTLFNRANVLRMKAEFDKAAELYEKILHKNESEAEAYWGLILCKYGIEYVEDPVSFKRVPTCHRASFDAVASDEDYKNALRYADAVQRGIYVEEAKTIDEIQKGILALAQKEAPYDVFICYKETDESGARTPDSVIANDIFYQLTQEGFKVFYAAITLEDKLGTEYEPYIFSALHSAKVMLALGTKPEHFNAVWVKNEWSRYLQIMKTDRSRLLIPCYKDMDPYELPEEFAHLQAQNMGKIGFISDLVRGIRKVIVKDAPAAAISSNASALMKRGFMALEDGEWKKADDFFEDVLNQDAECAEAYLGKLMAELCVSKKDSLKNCAQPFDDRQNCRKVLRFADAELKAKIESDNQFISERNEHDRLESIYTDAQQKMNAADTEDEYKTAAARFEEITSYRDAAAQAAKCREQAEICCKDAAYDSAKEKMNGERIYQYGEAIRIFETIPGWKDSDKQIEACQKKIEEIRAKEEADRLEAKRKAEADRIEAEKRAKKVRKIAIISAAAAVAAIAVALLITKVIIPGNKYKNAAALMEEGRYAEASAAFAAAGHYKDSVERRFAYVEENWASQWNTIAAGSSHTVGLKSDGTVVAVGDNNDGQCGVSGWTDIVAITAGYAHTVGLRSDGTAVAVGYNKYGQCDVSGWTDIVAIAADGEHTVGLRSDGTVVAVGCNKYGQCDVSGWTDIVAIAAGGSHTVGLRSDGTVVTVGNTYYGRCDVSGWTDIVAIGAGYAHTVGLKSDGTVVAVGDNGDGQCDVSEWKDIHLPY